MITNMLRATLAFLVLIGVSACGTGGMVKADQPVVVRPDEATVVFMRATMFGAAISAAVYDVTASDSKFIGIIEHGTKLAYHVPAGEHTFMVASEAADFMKATLSPGKTYYALVTPRMGAWRARFSFRPLRQADLAGAEFSEWDKGTNLVENSPKSLAWAAQNAASVQEKRTAYWIKWTEKPIEQQESQTLHAEDGQ